MRTIYQEKKRTLFERIQKATKGTRSNLLKKFNNMTPVNKQCDHGMFEECPDCYDSTQ